MTVREHQAGIPTTLATALANSSSALSFTVDSSTNWPDGSGGEFWVTVDAGTAQEERLLCESRIGDVVTVKSGGRGADGTSIAAHAAGASVWPSWSATDAAEANAHINASSAVHGLSGSVVGTTDTQTLTNKTLTSPKISGALVVEVEGATADDYETSISVTDPTADRSIVFPNASGNVVLDSATQTLSAKTLSSPTISGTLTLGSTAITATGTELNYTDGMGDAWSSHTPTVTGSWTSVTATTKYRKIGRIVHFRTTISATANSAGTTSISFTLPVAAAGDFAFACHNPETYSMVGIGGTGGATASNYPYGWDNNEGTTFTFSGTYESAS